jgi:hypothetical protein
MNKVHLCCGGVYLDGYVNIDKYPFEEGDDSRAGCVADLFADAFCLPYDNGSLDEIVLIHGLEHFTRYDGSRLLQSLAGLLSPSGILYLEMPSRNPVFVMAIFERLVASVFCRRSVSEFGHGAASSMLWGNQWAGFDYETHRYLWGTRELICAAEEVGLSYSLVFRMTSSHVPFRDMGIALSRDSNVRNYNPPTIRRRASHGILASAHALFVGTSHVLASLFNRRGAANDK